MVDFELMLVVLGNFSNRKWFKISNCVTHTALEIRIAADV